MMLAVEIRTNRRACRSGLYRMLQALRFGLCQDSTIFYKIKHLNDKIML